MCNIVFANSMYVIHSRNHTHTHNRHGLLDAVYVDRCRILPSIRYVRRLDDVPDKNDSFFDNDLRVSKIYEQS